MSSKKSVLVIGAGAAGLLAAGTAVRNGASVTLVDINAKPGRKLMITGKGRCNLTNELYDVNEIISNVVTNGKFLYSAFTSFMPEDIINLVESLGVPLKTERGKRVFPVSDRAADIVDALKKYSSGARYEVGRVVKLNSSQNHINSAVLNNGKTLQADAYVLATGGKSYSATGSSGDGYVFAHALGHTIEPLRPSLVSLTLKEDFCTDLQGLSLKNVSISLYESDRKKPLYNEQGEMLFTHYGVSGPLVLSASAHIKDIKNKAYKITLDLKPALTEKQLGDRIQRDFNENINKDFSNSLGALLPKKLIPVIVKLSGIEACKKVNQITKAERERLVKLLKNLTLHVKDYHSFEEAVVTAGGVKTNEINPKNMKSKIIDNLFFAGELIDVDAYTGGFNLQTAFSTGFLAGKAASEVEDE